MIEIRGLTKRFGKVVAVDDLSFDVSPGRVTGFLGPNGAGKSTTMRCMVGLDRPDGGTTTFDGGTSSRCAGRCTRSAPCSTPGTCTQLVPVAITCAGSPRATGCPVARVDEVLAMVGLTDAAGRRVRGYSLGMRQRLGLAGVLLGDPHTVILDEPANGLDPEGIRWIRDMLVYLAKQGRTVLVSSHLLSEISLMADDLVVIGRGRLIEQGRVSEFLDRHATRWVRVRTPTPAPFAEHLRHAGRDVLAGGARRHRRPRSGDGARGRAGGTARRRAARAVAAAGVARGRLLEGHGGRPGVSYRIGGAAAASWFVPGPGRRVVIDAIRSEWIKVSTIPVTWSSRSPRSPFRW